MKFLLRILLFFTLLFCVVSCVRKTGRRTSDAESSRRSRSQTTETRRSSSSSSSGTSPGNQRKMQGSEVFEKYNSAVFMIYTSDGVTGYQGSGFFVSSSGIGVSNYHVFEGTTIGFEQIKLSNNKTYKVKEVIASDKENDFIIFQVEARREKFKYIPLEHKQPKVGEKVFAIGSPRGLENTFSSGEISQIRSNNLIQISAPIDHGSSGGALLNEYGNAIGITTSGYDSGANLNFAVSVNVLKPYLK